MWHANTSGFHPTYEIGKNMNIIVAQCGGPTPVINASLAAIVQAAQAACCGRILGARYGLEGLAQGDWVDLHALEPGALEQLSGQPAAALGGSRYRPSDAEFAALPARLAAAEIGASFLIGGNGTMAAAQRLEAAAQTEGIALQVLGVPKTIDNDLPGGAVTPGYGSSARYIAHTVQEIGLDLRAMRGFDQVAVVEVMGRHSGWLAAASALARTQEGDPPHLILVPETPVAIDDVLRRTGELFHSRGLCVIVVAEGVHDAAGAYWAEMLGAAGADASGQRVFSMSAGASAFLVQQVQERLGLRCRQIKLNTAQRATRLLASPVDRELAALVGTAAVDAAVAGLSGVLPTLHREGDAWRTVCVPFAQVIGSERRLPPGYFDAARYDVTDACRAYIAPLLGSAPPAPRLWIA
jgi:6-phosphofructokinase